LSLTAANEETSAAQTRSSWDITAQQRRKTAFAFMETMHVNASAAEETLDLKEW